MGVRFLGRSLAPRRTSRGRFSSNSSRCRSAGRFVDLRSHREGGQRPGPPGSGVGGFELTSKSSGKLRRSPGRADVRWIATALNCDPHQRRQLAGTSVAEGGCSRARTRRHHRTWRDSRRRRRDLHGAPLRPHDDRVVDPVQISARERRWSARPVSRACRRPGPASSSRRQAKQSHRVGRPDVLMDVGAGDTEAGAARPLDRRHPLYCAEVLGGPAQRSETSTAWESALHDRDRELR